MKIVEEDAALSTKILSVANSAYFATTSEIGDLTTACSRLGMRALANIAHTMASANQYRSPNPEVRTLMERLWTHGVATAHCADAIADAIRFSSPLVYVSGLLHDIGKVVLIDTITSRYEGNVGRLKEAPDVLARAIEPFGPIIGLQVMQHWNLQSELLMTTFFSQKPEATIREDCVRLAHCVRLASDMAEAKGYGVGQASKDSLTLNPSIEALGLNESQFEELSASLDASLNSVIGAYGNFI